ncbi:hypothetical protein PASE110613_15240 [Paenibacillus sediminis]|uniref:DUF4352 domain-containing protein n=1 Tax=Paenibacillus sediminis TaxID=664909 RepID=A0ABS4H4M1_9BACL|nr:hypothetical protein [Paenibacillus sediminis]MBP1937317.1 hypothetical protein [Paenibacillus sediminis]
MKKLLLIFIIVIVTGCSSTASRVVPIHYKETIGDLAYEILLSKKQFGLNDEIAVYAKVTNIGKNSISYGSGSSSCPNNLLIQIVNKNSKEYLNAKLELDATRKACSTDINSSELKPSQTIDQKLVFVPMSGKNRADPGTYDVKVSLPLKRHSAFLADKPKLYPSVKTSIIIK